jgi:hypothetical protein
VDDRFGATDVHFPAPPWREHASLCGGVHQAVRISSKSKLLYGVVRANEPTPLSPSLCTALHGVAAVAATDFHVLLLEHHTSCRQPTLLFGATPFAFLSSLANRCSTFSSPSTLTHPCTTSEPCSGRRWEQRGFSLSGRDQQTSRQPWIEAVEDR